jgi:hypothetical protein
MPEDSINHNHCYENLKSYIFPSVATAYNSQYKQQIKANCKLS